VQLQKQQLIIGDGKFGGFGDDSAAGVVHINNGR